MIQLTKELFLGHHNKYDENRAYIVDKNNQIVAGGEPIMRCKCPLRPPWSFFPKGYPTTSPLYKVTQFKKQTRKDWSWKPKKDR